jgi:heme/copper-type cytochrome/quinol oxidase subunit 2
MRAKVVVETPADFQKWVRGLDEKVPAPLAESIKQDTETNPAPLSAGGA